MLAQLPTSGFSDEAQQIAKATREQQRNLRRSAALGNQDLFDELATVWDECRYPNWDGYRALAVPHETYCNTYRLLEALPMGLPSPSIGAEPDGELTLEWHHSLLRTLSVSVTDDGYLHYSGLFGPNHTNGTIAFFGELPVEILALIERVHGT